MSSFSTRTGQFHELLFPATNLTLSSSLTPTFPNITLTDCPRSTNKAIINLIDPASYHKYMWTDFSTRFVTNLVTTPLRCYNSSQSCLKSCHKSCHKHDSSQILSSPPLRCHGLTTIHKLPARAGDTQSPNFAQDEKPAE